MLLRREEIYIDLIKGLIIAIQTAAANAVLLYKA